MLTILEFIWEMLKTNLGSISINLGKKLHENRLICEVWYYKLLIILQNGFITSLPHILLWLFSISVGTIADWLIERKIMSITSIRRLCNSIGFFGPAIGLTMLGLAGCNTYLAIMWLYMSVTLNGAVYSGFRVLCT